MKAVILCAVCGLAFIAYISGRFRFARKDVRTAGYLTKSYLVSLLFVVALHWLTPADLWFLPLNLTASTALDLGFLLFLYSALFFGGYLQLYGLTDRGFSVRMSVDIAQTPGQKMTIDDVVRSYAAGKGTTWAYERRLSEIQNLNLAVRSGDDFVITSSGLRIARVLGWIRTFLRIDG